jgi:hypothetical protein
LRANDASKSRPAAGTTTRSVASIDSIDVEGSSRRLYALSTGSPRIDAVRTRNRGSTGCPCSVFHSRPAAWNTSSGPIVVDAKLPCRSTTVTSIIGFLPLRVHRPAGSARLGLRHSATSR